jgi:hypothetical protein
LSEKLGKLGGGGTVEDVELEMLDMEDLSE